MGLKRDDIRPDGTFLLRDRDIDKCLGPAPDDADHFLGMVPCEDRQRWRWMQQRQQVQHVATSMCIDANDNDRPLLYPCHEPRAEEKQQFRIVDAPGWVQLKGSWSDNGRKRVFERCLDHRPEKDMEISVQKCEGTEARGISFSRIGVRSSREYELWQ